MKKLLFYLCIALVVMLVACGKKQSPDATASLLTKIEKNETLSKADYDYMTEFILDHKDANINTMNEDEATTILAFALTLAGAPEGYVTAENDQKIADALNALFAASEEEMEEDIIPDSLAIDSVM